MPWERPLTGIERWQWLFDRAAPMNLVYVARVAGRFAHADLRGALDAVVDHYPILAARIVAGRVPHLEALAGEIDLQVQPWAAGAWRRVAVEEANSRVPTDGGTLARAVLLDGQATSDLIVTFNQAVFDGRSGALIVDEILRLQAGEARPALPAVEVQASPLKLVMGSRLSSMLGTLGGIHKKKPRMSPLPPVESAPPERRSTGLIDARLPGRQVERLAHEAATHGSSVHGALAAAVLINTATLLRSIDRVPKIDVGCTTSIDLRRHTKLPASWVGSLTSRLESTHSIHHDTLFWDLAGAVSRAVREAVGSGAMFSYVQRKEREAIGVADSQVAARVAKAERSHRAAVVVNNLGRLDFYRRYGDVELQRLGFLVSNNADVGSAIVLNAATAAETTCLNFTYAHPLLSAERAQTISDGALATLQQVIEESR